jgi:dihydrofolate synthase/folylpolyglutamate synthase
VTYSEAIQFLHSLQMFGARFGLETTRTLADSVGNPQELLRFIHVAGTNGKGSTCAMLEGIYRAAGLRVGLFTSPHLVSFRERMQVNRQPISEADVARLVEHTARFTRAPETTFFEFVTVLALQYFAEAKCDLVIWETGLGGRLDATNIVTPIASVITNISLDHQRWLGETLVQIAAEKAGIIKFSVPIVTTTTNPEALAVITETAKRLHAPLSVVDKTHASHIMRHAKSPLAGEHQKVNASLAIQTVEVVQTKIPVSEAAIRRGLESVNWPGRLQLITRPDGPRILLDGAHNVAGAETLRTALQQDSVISNLVRTGCTLILGVMQDKDWRTICEMLAPLAQRIMVVAVACERTASPTELAQACRQANEEAVVTVSESLGEALRRVPAKEFIVITGSLYLVGEALALINPSGTAAVDEQSLNNWQRTARDV